MRPDRINMPDWQASERWHFKVCLALSAVLHITCAVVSAGFHQADEYFSVIEFASTKLGITDPADLPWEYPARMRAWLLPALFVGVAKTAGSVGIESPYTQLMLFRLLAAVLSWSALWTMIAAGRGLIADAGDRRQLYWIAALLWLLPYLGARTSGETLSTAALCVGIALMQWRAARPATDHGIGLAILAGLAFGLCFGFRYPSGVMAAGAALWYIVVERRRVVLLAGLACGGVMALALCALADYWGYGALTFPAANYVHQNFILGRASEFGTDPFFAYFYLPLMNPMAPLVLVLMAATLVAWWRHPGSVLTWATAPYAVLLSLTAHKEMRFLFPLAPFLPFFAVLALARCPARGARSAAALAPLARGTLLWMLMTINAVGLLGVLLVPARGYFPLYRSIERISDTAGGPIVLAVIDTPHRSPYREGLLPVTFLKPRNLELVLDAPPAALETRRARGEPFLAWWQRSSPPSEAAAWVHSHCRLEQSMWPRWLLHLNYFNWQRRMSWIELYRC